MFRRQNTMNNNELVVALRHNNSQPLGFGGGPPPNAYQNMDSMASMPLPPPSKMRASYMAINRKGSFRHVQNGPPRASRPGLLRKFRERSAKGSKTLFRNLAVPKPNSGRQFESGPVGRKENNPLPPPISMTPVQGNNDDDGIDDDSSQATEWTDNGQPVPPVRTFTPPQSLLEMSTQAQRDKNKTKTTKKKTKKSVVSHNNVPARSQMPRRPENYGQPQNYGRPQKQQQHQHQQQRDRLPNGQHTTGNRKETVFGFDDGQARPPPPPIRKSGASTTATKYSSPSRARSAPSPKNNRPALRPVTGSNIKTSTRNVSNNMTSVPTEFQMFQKLGGVSKSGPQNPKKKMTNRSTGQSIGERRGTRFGFGPNQAAPPPPPTRSSGRAKTSAVSEPILLMSRRSVPHSRPLNKKELSALRPLRPVSPVLFESSLKRRSRDQSGRRQPVPANTTKGGALAKKAVSVPVPAHKKMGNRVNTGRSNASTRSEHFGPRPSMLTMKDGDVGRLVSKFAAL